MESTAKSSVKRTGYEGVSSGVESEGGGGARSNSVVVVAAGGGDKDNGDVLKKGLSTGGEAVVVPQASTPSERRTKPLSGGRRRVKERAMSGGSDKDGDGDSEEGGDQQEGSPLHHISPPRTSTIVDNKNAAARGQASPTATAKARSRTHWKSKRAPVLEPSEDAPVVQGMVPILTSPIHDDFYDRPQSPSSSPVVDRMARIRTPPTDQHPPGLPTQSPPQAYPFIHHLPPPLQSPTRVPELPPPSLSGPARVGPTTTPRPIAPRTQPGGTPSPSQVPRQNATNAVTGSPTRTHATSSASPQRPHVCPLCSMPFARAHDLKRHSTTHTGEKNHKCPACGKAYGRRDALKRHACAAGAGAGASTMGYYSMSAMTSPTVAAASGTMAMPQAGPSGGRPSAKAGRTSPTRMLQPVTIDERSAGPSGGHTTGRVTRSKGQLHAPPIVGAAARMLGDTSTSRAVASSGENGVREIPSDVPGSTRSADAVTTESTASRRKRHEVTPKRRAVESTKTVGGEEEVQAKTEGREGGQSPQEADVGPQEPGTSRPSNSERKQSDEDDDDSNDQDRSSSQE
ncbi:hypothetical protein FRB99_001744 [Tulasnella sp. 403]|nr:hypothetical protein FRB99_001744 [Tulasnella sp. 403]